MNKKLIAHIKYNVKRVVAPLLFYTGYYDYLLSKLRDEAIILMYHRVSNFNQGNEFHTGFEIGVTKENFEAQMKCIREKMNPISLTDLVKCITIKKAIPEKAIAVTFDDGYEDNYTNAYPILKKYNIPATIFLTTGHIETTKIFWWEKVNEIITKTNKPVINLRDFQGFARNGYIYSPRSIMLNRGQGKMQAMKTITELFKTFEYNRINEAVALLQKAIDVEEREISGPPMLNWHQIREMSNNGIDFGAHTVTHVNLAGVSPDHAEEEINGSKRIIEEKINKPVYGFAYPYGLEQHFNGQTIKNVKNSGFHYACSAITGVIAIGSDIYSLKRVSMPNVPLPISIWNICKNIKA